MASRLTSDDSLSATAQLFPQPLKQNPKRHTLRTRPFSISNKNKTKLSVHNYFSTDSPSNSSRMIGANFSPIQTAPPISTLNRPFNLQLLSSFLSRRRKKINAAVLISVDRSEMDWIRRFSVGCFSDRRSNKDFKMEADSGGVDVFSTYAKPPPEHLIIMVNGLIGRLVG